jgi:hypothetical protein
VGISASPTLVVRLVVTLEIAAPDTRESSTETLFNNSTAIYPSCLQYLPNVMHSRGKQVSRVQDYDRLI